MGVFIGRERELAKLEEIWNRPNDRGCVVYGRRRTGKSELPRRFCKGRHSIYIECVQGSMADNLHNIALVLTVFDGKRREDYTFLKDSLDDVLRICREGKTAAVFDEIPHLMSVGDQTSSLI